MEHLERPWLTFQAIHTILKPGGVFIFLTPNGRHPLTWLNRAFGRLGQLQGFLVERLYQRAENDTFATFYRANTMATVHTLCQQTGLEIIDLESIPDPTYLAFSTLLFRASCWFEEALPQNSKIHLLGLIRRPPENY